MKFRELLLGMRDADYGEQGLRCMRLFDVAEEVRQGLRQEVEDLIESITGSDVAQTQHVTHWVGPRGQVVQYSLLNSSGRYSDTTTDHLLTTRAKYFAGRRRYPLLARLIACFPEAINFRVNLLGPNAALSAHEEHITVRTRSGAIALKARFHLPVLTNAQAEVLLGGEIFHFEQGAIFYFNNGCVHAASNAGATHRVHLVWDMLLTESACERMFGSGPHGLPASRVTGPRRRMAARRRADVSEYRRTRPAVSRDEALRVGYFTLQ